MPIPQRVDVDGYPAQLLEAAAPHLAMLRCHSLAVVPDLVETELPITGPGR